MDENTLTVVLAALILLVALPSLPGLEFLGLGALAFLLPLATQKAH